MTFLYVKALHIIFVVTWFAGLFYIVRLFVYHVEASEKQSPEKEILISQFKIMQRRLWYGITWPSAILATFFGLWLVHLYGSIPSWLVVKLCFVVGLWVYHLSCQRIYSKQQNEKKTLSSIQLRLWNEVATIFLFSIVFLVTLKDTLDMFWAVLATISVSIVLYIAILVYKKIRNK